MDAAVLREERVNGIGAPKTSVDRLPAAKIKKMTSMMALGKRVTKERKE